MKRRKPKDADNGFGEWGGYMEAKISKLEDQYATDALNNPYKESDLFAGISIFVNGLTDPSAGELKRIMMKNGGVYHTYQRSSTKFVIATNLPDVKIRQITTAKIVSPQWIVDCLGKNKILDYSKYLLYTNCKVSQPKINFTKPEIKPQCSTNHEDHILATTADKLDGTIDAALPVIEQSNPSQNEAPHAKPKESILKNLSVLNKIIKVDLIDEKKPQTKSSIVNDDNKKGVARSAVDPNFLSEFYNNSRLHLISTLGAGFKSHITKLREAHDGSFPARDKLRSLSTDSAVLNDDFDNQSKVIMHIDMDCFFVSVGLRSRPHLKGHPVAVTHSKGGNQMKARAGSDRQKESELYRKKYGEKATGYNDDDDDDGAEVEEAQAKEADNTSSMAEIASCSYEARKMGIRNGMFVGAALKLCSNLKTMPYDFDAYKEVAYTLYNIIAQYTLNIEAVSCDEMYVDLVEILKNTKVSVTDFVSYIRNEITEKTQCPCSAGIGANKLQARMATKKAKPNGQFYLKTEDVEAYFRDISVSDLPGVGYSTTQKLSQLKLHTCSELQTLSIDKLQQQFGKKLGDSLYQHCRGIDSKSLTYDQVRKSVSVDVNYGIRFTEHHQVDTFLNQLCAEIHSRLTEIRAKGKTITLKILVRAPEAPVETAKFLGCGFCDQVTKSSTLQYFTDDLSVIGRTVLTINSSLNLPPHELRGIGIQITKLNSAAADQTKSNVLRSMFNKVKEKNEVLKNAIRPDEEVPTIAASEYIVDSIANIYPDGKIETSAAATKTTTTTATKTAANKRNIRKVKSFSSTETRESHQLFSNRSSKTSAKVERIYEELDLSTLAELPEDIREEVLKEQKRLLKSAAAGKKGITNNLRNSEKSRSLEELMISKLGPKPSPNTVNGEKVVHPLFNINQEPLQRPVEQISHKNFLVQQNWRDVLLTWLESADKPTECDIQIIGNFFKELLTAGMLEDLHLRLKFLQRKISETTDCEWHQVYYKIINPIQIHMSIVYGRNYRLLIKTDASCKHCFNPDYKVSSTKRSM